MNSFIGSTGYLKSIRPSLTKAGAGSSRYVGFIILALLALLYIAQASQAATKKVEVQNLRQKADSLANDVDQLKLESDRAQTLDMISTQASSLGLVPVDSVEYLK